MAQTFPCPYCGTTYPVKPVLVDRPVRCTNCKNVFQLQESGTARKVDPPEQPAAAKSPPVSPEPPPPAPKPPPVSPEPPAAPDEQRPAGPPASPTPPPPPKESDLDLFDESGDHEAIAPKQPDTETRRKSSTRLTARQETIRRTMSATLKDAASQALKSEAVKREEEKRSRDEKKKKIKEGAVGEFGPAVLTGEGEREQRNNRQWAIGCLLVVLLTGGWFLFGRQQSPEERALSDFVATPVTDEDKQQWKFPFRIPFVRQRAWIPTPAMPFITNLDDAELGERRDIDLKNSLTELEDRLGGHRLVAAMRAWVPALQVDEALKIHATFADDESRLSLALAEADIEIIPDAKLPELLAEVGLDDYGVAMVLHLLRSNVGSDGQSWIRDRWTVGTDFAANLADEPSPQMPERIEIVHFGGTDGRRLHRKGRQYQIISNQVFRGRLLRFVGKHWREYNAKHKKYMDRWYVLDVQVASKNGSFPPAVGYAEPAPEDAGDTTEDDTEISDSDE